MFDEEMAMMEELEADVLRSQEKLAELQETTAILEQGLLDIEDLYNEDDPEFDASVALLTELKAAIAIEKERKAEFSAEVAELDRRRLEIKERLRKYE